MEGAKLLLQSLLDLCDQIIMNITNINIDGHLHFDDVVGFIIEEESRRESKVEEVESSKQVEF